MLAPSVRENPTQVVPSSSLPSRDRRRREGPAAPPRFQLALQQRADESLEQIRRVLAIPFKKTDARLVPYPLREELQAHARGS